jgi:hypothetical protein
MVAIEGLDCSRTTQVVFGAAANSFTVMSGKEFRMIALDGRAVLHLIHAQTGAG